MTDLKFDSINVIRSAESIEALNKQMNETFSSVESAISQLDTSWDGAAAVVAIGKFRELTSKFQVARYTILNDYVRFLFQQVGEGYTQTEDTNVSLADQFK